MDAAMADRVIGVAQGLAIGDLMGAPFEGIDLATPFEDNPRIMEALRDGELYSSMQNWGRAAASLVSYVQLNGGIVRDYLGALNTTYWEPGETTDDTSKAVATMHSIVATGGVDRSSLCGHMWQLEPFPSNGALMHIPVVALLFLGDNVEEKKINLAADTVTGITHPYPQCYQTSRLLVTMIRDLVLTGDVNYALQKASRRYPNIMKAAWRALNAPSPHTGGNLETLEIALSALATSTNYEQAVVHAINASTRYGAWATDSDTYGAVTGALAGAAYGASSIPINWTDPVNLSGDPIDIGPVGLDELAEMALATVGVAYH